MLYSVPLNCCHTCKTKSHYTCLCLHHAHVSKLSCVSQQGDHSALYSSYPTLSLTSVTLPSTDEHGCQSQHVSNSNFTSIKHPLLLPSPHSLIMANPYHISSIIINNGNFWHQAYSIPQVSIFIRLKRHPSPLCPPLKSIKWSSPQNDSCHRRNSTIHHAPHGAGWQMGQWCWQ